MKNNFIKIALSGATGFIGKNLIKNWGTEIYPIVRKDSDLKYFQEAGFKAVLYDGSLNSLNDFFGQNKIDVILHLATLYIFNHKSEEIDGLIDANIKFGVHLLEAASNNGCKNFINTGSYIQNYFSEEYFPSCLYAATKQAMQDIADFYALQKNMNIITLKLFDVYGPNDTRKKILNLFKESQEKSEKLRMSPGLQEIRLTYIDDVIEAFTIAIDQVKKMDSKHEIYYVGGQAYKLKKAAEIFEKVSKKSLDIEWGAFPYRHNQPMKSYIGKSLPRWRDKTSLEIGIQKTFFN